MDSIIPLQDRLTIYQRAKSLYRSKEEIYGGVCGNLDGIAVKMGYSKAITYSTRLTFPEFYAQKPDEADATDYWWEPGDRASRIYALDAAITLCEKQLTQTA